MEYGNNVPEEELNQEPPKERTARDIALEKWHKFGQFGVTAKDHTDIGGSPPLELSRNHGKTQGELWSIEQIREKLDKLKSFLESAREKHRENPNDDWSTDDIKYAKKELRLAIPYLESLGKLPEEFKDLRVEDLPDDPS